MKFKDLNFKKELLKGIKVARFRNPSPIQKRVIPIIQDGYDLVPRLRRVRVKLQDLDYLYWISLAKGKIDRAFDYNAYKRVGYTD